MFRYQILLDINSHISSNLVKVLYASDNYILTREKLDDFEKEHPNKVYLAKVVIERTKA